MNDPRAGGQPPETRTDRARWATGVLGVFLLLATLVAAVGAIRLRFADDYQEVFRTHRQDFRLLEEIGREFGSDGDELVVLFESPDLLDRRAVAALESLTSRLVEIEGVDAVDSPTRASGLLRLASTTDDEQLLSTLREAIGRHPLLAGQLVTRDLAAALLVLHLDRELGTLQELEPVLARVEKVLSGAATSGLAVAWTGLPRLRAEIVRSVQRDQVVFTVTGVLLGALLLLALLRRPASALLAAIGPLLGALWTVGAMGWLGWPLDVMNNVVPVLVLVTGMTDSIHLVRELHRQLARGLDPRAATRRALRTVGPACALASLTTLLAFSSLALADFRIVRRLGLACAGGLVLSLAAVLATFRLLGGETRLGRPGAVSGFDLPRGVLSALRASRRHPRPVVATGLAALVLTALSLALIHPDYRYREYLPTNSEALRGLERIEHHFEGFFPLRVVVDWQPEVDEGAVLASLGAIESALAESPVAVSPLSVARLLGLAGSSRTEGEESTPDGLPVALTSRFWRPDLRRALVTARVPDLGARALEPHLRRLETEFARVAAATPGLRVELNGLLSVTSRTSVRMIATLAKSLALAGLLIFVTIGVATRSLRMALLSLPPNLLPLSAICALLAITGRPLQFTTVTLLTVVLGIAVDDTIHLLSAFRRERPAAASAGAAIERAVESVGGSLVATTCLFCVGFAAVGLSRAPLMSLFGWLAVLALVVALLADLILLPALLEIAYGRQTPRRAASAGKEAF